MSNLTAWSRPAWDNDRWLRDFFGPANSDWEVADTKPVTSGFNPAAEIIQDGDDAVVRVELPGVDVEKDVTGEAIAASYDAGVLTVRVAGAYAGAAAQRIAITK